MGAFLFSKYRYTGHMKPILFIDFDGTLCHDRFWSHLSLDKQELIQNYLFKENSHIVIDWMKGKYNSEEINQLISEKLNLNYQEIWNSFVLGCQKMYIHKTNLEIIRELRKKYCIVLITDNMDCFDRFTLPALNLQDYFDLIINSYNEGISKNEKDGALFIKVLSRLNTDIKNSTLLDNSQNTCQIFDRLGGQSKLVTTEKDVGFWLKAF